MFLQLDSVYLSSWNVFTKNWWQYIVVSLIMALLLFIPLGGILQFFVMLLFLNAVLKVLRGDIITFSSFLQFKEIFNTKVIVMVVILGLYAYLMQVMENPAFASVFGIITFILSIIFFPVLCVLIDKKFNIKETFVYSAKLTKNLRFEIFLIMLLNFVIGLIGFLLFFVGIFVAIPVITIVNAKTYLLLEEKINSQQ